MKFNLKLLVILSLLFLNNILSKKKNMKKDITDGLSEEEKSKHFKDAKNIRNNYKKTVESIAETIKDISDLYEKAKTAYEIRHNARLKARSLMQKYLTLGLFKTACLNIRDYFTYGDKDGPTFEGLIEQYFKKNPEKSRTANMNDAYEKIIQSSQSTNNIVDSWFGVSKKKRVNTCEMDSIVHCSSC